MGTKDNVHGEGNYRATRDYNERTRKFMKTHDVEQAARDAAPHSDAEARDMAQAEAIGKARGRDLRATGGRAPGARPPRAGKGRS
jgi:hypothetical protein